MEAIPYLAALSALAGLGLAGYYYTLVKAASPGDDRMVFLMTEIQKGARAFLQAEYKWVGVFAVADGHAAGRRHRPAGRRHLSPGSCALRRAPAMPA